MSYPGGGSSKVIRYCERCGKRVVTTREFDRRYPAGVDCGKCGVDR
jgi:bacterioferritin-associated ferredoxin